MMPNMAKDDAKMKERIDQERTLTIMMLIYTRNFKGISIFFFFINLKIILLVL